MSPDGQVRNQEHSFEMVCYRTANPKAVSRLSTIFNRSTDGCQQCDRFDLHRRAGMDTTPRLCAIFQLPFARQHASVVSNKTGG